MPRSCQNILSIFEPHRFLKQKTLTNPKPFEINSDDTIDNENDELARHQQINNYETNNEILA